MPTPTTQTIPGGKPRFDKRSIVAGLIIWAVAIALFTVALDPIAAVPANRPKDDSSFKMTSLEL